MGGITNHVDNISKNLIGSGNQVTIVCPKNILSQSKLSYSDNIRVERVSSIFMNDWPYQTLKSISFPIDAGKKIRNVIRKFNPDIIHVHGHHYPLSWTAIYYAKKYDIPCILTLHGMYALNPKSIGGKSFLEEIFNKLIFTRIIRKTDAVIGLTRTITEYAMRYGRNSSKYYTVANGVDTRLFYMNQSMKLEYRRLYGIREKSIVIIFRGRFEHVKGILEFTVSMRKLLDLFKDKVEVVIVGEGSLRDEVITSLSGVDGAHIYDWQPRERVHELYIASDIFVIPSKFEALPITVIEAMNSSLHIVYTPVGGIPDILHKYSAKTILRNGTPEEIQSVLKQLIESGISSPDQVSLAYAREYDWVGITKSLINVYESVIRDYHEQNE